MILTESEFETIERAVTKAQEWGCSEMTIGSLHFKFWPPKAGATVSVPAIDDEKPRRKRADCAGCGHPLAGHAGSTGCLECGFNARCVEAAMKKAQGG